MQACKPVDTPIKKGSTLSISMYPQTLEEKEKMAQVPYSNTVGSLMYTIMCTRPDICHAIGLVSRFQANLGIALESSKVDIQRPQMNSRLYAMLPSTRTALS